MKKLPYLIMLVGGVVVASFLTMGDEWRSKFFKKGL